MADCLVKEVAKGAKEALTEVVRSGKGPVWHCLKL